MNRIYFLAAFIIYHLSLNNIASAQTAKVYRGGALLSTHSTLIAACSAANVIGDSILLSAHTFFEHNIAAQGGQTWQGTYTAIDSTIIDAQSMGRVFSVSPIKKSDTIVIRNIICQNGKTIYPQLDGGGIDRYEDLVMLAGYTIVRNCFALRNGGGTQGAWIADDSKIQYNNADSFGGGCYSGVLADRAQVNYNNARYGGGIANQGPFSIVSINVKIANNIALIAGGGVYGNVYSSGTGFQITNNQAPIGSGVYGKSLPSLSAIGGILSRAYIYNPAPDGSRQNELYIDGAYYYIEGTWFGSSDTTGLIAYSSNPCKLIGKYATTSWSVNRGAALSAKDTLFPIGAAFVYNDGTPMPPDACPWLVGKFSASTGTMLTPNPVVNAKDTMSSLFRSYAYPVGGSGSKPIDFLCIVDQDTFRISKAVWGRTPLGIKENIEEQNVLVYPNPAKDFININGASIGSNIALYDLLGHLIKNEKSTINNVVMDVKGLPAGTYILKITTEEGREGSANIILNGE